jgi:hypothetical protein
MTQKQKNVNVSFVCKTTYFPLYYNERQREQMTLTYFTTQAKLGEGEENKLGEGETC